MCGEADSAAMVTEVIALEILYQVEPPFTKTFGCGQFGPLADGFANVAASGVVESLSGFRNFAGAGFMAGCGTGGRRLFGAIDLSSQASSSCDRTFILVMLA